MHYLAFFQHCFIVGFWSFWPMAMENHFFKKCFNIFAHFFCFNYAYTAMYRE